MLIELLLDWCWWVNKDLFNMHPRNNILHGEISAFFKSVFEFVVKNINKERNYNFLKFFISTISEKFVYPLQNKTPKTELTRLYIGHISDLCVELKEKMTDIEDLFESRLIR